MKLQIERAVYGGAGASHPSNVEGLGNVVFVPFTLPGEDVEVALADEKQTSGEAILTNILSPSANRVTPGCAHFGQCGGCQYQHANYSTQVDMKVEILRETLQRAGLSELPEIYPHVAAEWGYRNRARLRLEDVDGTMQIGYNRRSTHEFLAIHECPILVPLLWHAANALVQLGEQNTVAGRWVREAVEAEFFTDAEEKKLQLTIFVRKDRPGFNEFCDQLRDSVPQLVGVGTALLPAQKSPRRLQRPRQLSDWGTEGLSYKVAQESYWVSRGSFFQVNRFLLDSLVKLVTEGRKGSLAWDLYAGVGLFSRVLARQFEQVIAVETVGSDLAKSFKGPGKRAVEATTAEFLRGAVVQRERPDLIVIDPPRAGAGAEVCELLARVSAAELLYVSCDPLTLARDLKLLIEAGYRLAELHMMDLFPQTFHLETVAVLRKSYCDVVVK
jgi:23S rRNA (uracil1939-C5)-methyltransferase